MSSLVLAQNVVKRVYPRSSECVVKVHYHDHSNIVKNTREADPDMFKVQSQNYLEGPFSLIGDFAYLSVKITRQKDDPVDCDRTLGEQVALGILMNGKQIEGFGKWWAYAHWMARGEACFVMTREQHSLVLDKLQYELLGFESRGLPAKISKYVKRLFAHHHHGMFFGKVSNTFGNLSNVRMENGKLFSYRAADFSLDSKGRPYDDGLSPLVLSAAQMLLGRHVKVGDGYQITALTPHGFLKGHVIIVPDAELDEQGCDLLAIGMKKELNSINDQFSIGFLQEIHGRDTVYTDFQSMINFRFWHFLKEWAHLHFIALREEHLDEERVKRMVTSMAEASHSDTEWFEDDYAISAAVKANEKYDLGLNPCYIPALTYRDGRRTEQEIGRMHMGDWADGVPGTGKLRVRYPATVAVARYLIVNRTAFNQRTGEIDPKLDQLKRGQAFAGGELGEFVRQETIEGRRVYVYVFRQPNTHSGEKYKLELVWNQELAGTFGDSPFVQVSSKTYPTLAGICGGADQDDSFIMIIDPKVVEHMDNLPKYPKKRSVAPALPEVLENKDPLSIAQWDEAVAFTPLVMGQLIHQQAHERENIGSVIAPGMLFNDKLALAKELDKSWSMKDVYDFSPVMWDGEVIFDSVAKNGASVNWVTDEKVAMFTSMTGKQVPMWTAKKLGYWVKKYELQPTMTPLDEIIEWIAAEHKVWRQWMKRHTHLCVLKHWPEENYLPARYMGSHIFPPQDEAYTLAKAMRTVYLDTLRSAKQHCMGIREEGGALKLGFEKMALRNNQLTPRHPYAGMTREQLPEHIRKQMDDGPLDKEIGLLAYMTADLVVYRQFSQAPGIHKAMIVSWQNIYGKAVMPKKGVSVNQLPDAFLWGRHTTEMTINAMIWAKRNMPGPDGFNPQDPGDGDIPPAPEELAQPLAPVNLDYLVVVNGNMDPAKMNLIGTEGLERWRQSLLGKMVTLRPVLYKGERGYQVLVAGNHRAWIGKELVSALWLANGDKSLAAQIIEGHSPLTLTAAVIRQ